MVYRPLYHCVAKPGSFEAHTMAASHFSRWDTKFRRVEDVEAELDPATKAYLLDGPFVADPSWVLPLRTAPLGLPAAPGAGAALERSHEAPQLRHVIGEVGAFIEAVHSHLLEAGLDAIALGYEMDHICYRARRSRSISRCWRASPRGSAGCWCRA